MLSNNHKQHAVHLLGDKAMLVMLELVWRYNFLFQHVLVVNTTGENEKFFYSQIFCFITTTPYYQLQ
jgi:hypothetical protein